jgi:Mn-dependent DtxR family transcriptional regulator
MILKGIAMGKTYREIQGDILVKSINTVEKRMENLRKRGYVRWVRYERERRLTDAGRELLRKALS